MLLERRDVELLRLAGRYRWLPYEGLDNYGFNGLREEIDKLSLMQLFHISRNNEFIQLTPPAYELLEGLGYCYPRGGRRAFAGSPTLRRRLETSNIMLTCLRAGIDTLQDDMAALRNQPVFFPAFALRPQMMNCANCSGFGHWGDTAFMLQYISPESRGMYLVNELGSFHNLSSTFGYTFKTPTAMIIAGKSYGEIYKQLNNTAPSYKDDAKGFVKFSKVYQDAGIPIHIASCDEVGARQLAVMSKPDYKQRIAKAAYGERWIPNDEMIPEADGCVDGSPLVIAVGMDIRRIERAVKAAVVLNRQKVLVAAFREQIDGLLRSLFPRGGITQLLVMQEPTINAAFERINLYDMDRSPAYSEKGGVVNV